MLLACLLGGAGLLFSLSGKKGKLAAVTANPVLPTSSGPVSQEPLVTIEAVSSKRKYHLAVADRGTIYWIDRKYQITAISPGLVGCTLIRGGNDDKNLTTSTHLTLKLGSPAVIYIGYDKRGTVLPAWLADGTWRLTSEAITASGGDLQASPMKVYSKRFLSGRIILGGNKQPPAVGAGSNYVVIVKAG